MRELNMYELDIGTRDKYIDQIEKQICAKRELLMNKRRTLQDANGKNKYLTGVRNDYLKYQQYIMGQRKKQMDQMNILSKHIDDIIDKNKLTDKDLADARREQDIVLKEIEGIKGGVDELISE
mgnify:CR=1 FL=1|jgi:uncharacterized protein (DUF3084 family)|tara:strand:+ start:2381 stop:2749 length:369 start_codon:yes stop_codon:yes gene_type:complete